MSPAGAEVTIEANPGPDERGDAHAWRAAGVTRLSLGAQSLSDTELRRLGRRHRAADVASAVSAARDAGIGSISLDLLYDIPGATLADWAATLEAALALEPDHLSLYALTLDDPDAEGLTGRPATTCPRHPAPVDGGPALDRARTRIAPRRSTSTPRRVWRQGWHGYEISNWARPDTRAGTTWSTGSAGRTKPSGRARTPSTVRRGAGTRPGWMAIWRPSPRPTAAPQLPPGGAETLDAATAAAESIILGLRTDRGVPLAATHEPPFDEAFRWALDSDLVESPATIAWS